MAKLLSNKQVQEIKLFYHLHECEKDDTPLFPDDWEYLGTWEPPLFGKSATIHVFHGSPQEEHNGFYPGDKNVVIIHPNIFTHADLIDTIAHESLHAIVDILKKLDVTNIQEAEEVYTHCVGNLSRFVYELIKKEWDVKKSPKKAKDKIGKLK